MTDLEAFQVKGVIRMINTIFIRKPNHCDLVYFIKLEKELTEKLREYNEKGN